MEEFANRDTYYRRMAAAYGASICVLCLCFAALSLYEPKVTAFFPADEEIQLVELNPPEINIPELTEQPKTHEQSGSNTNPVIPEEIIPTSEAPTIPANTTNERAEIVPLEKGNPAPEKTEAENKVSFRPKQVKEVLPAGIDESAAGTITLQLRIGTNGAPISHLVLVNTVLSDDVLRKVIDAAYSSRWQPLNVNGSTQEYLIEKSYTFGKLDY